MSTELIPPQEKGKSVHLQEEVNAPDENAAKEIFQQAVYLLQRPGLWHESAGILSASFSIDTKDGREELECGDHIRIAIPGPGLSEGDGDDWVRADEIDKDFEDRCDESYGILLVVCSNPHKDSDATAHFFAEGASSSLLLKRKEKNVTAIYIGRNEEPNTDDLSFRDKLRNKIVAGGALAGISELQWSALLKGLLGSK